MRVERDHRTLQILRARFFHHGAEDFLMPQVHAIEIADRERGAATLRAELCDPIVRRVEDGEGASVRVHARRASSFNPSCASFTLAGSAALVSSCARSWQMCVKYASFGFTSATSASDCSTFECVGC